MKRCSAILLSLVCILQLVLAQPAPEKIDTSVISKIKDEGLNRSQIMEIASYLTDVYGPRLTGSPQYRKAAEWTKGKMTEIGLMNVAFEEWDFGKGWTLDRFSVQVIEPQTLPLIAFPKAWSPGIKGTLSAEAVYLDIKSDSDFAKYKGKLKKAIVLLGESRKLDAHFKPLAERTSDEDLLRMANADPTRPRGRYRMYGDSAAMRRYREQARMERAKYEFCQKEGAAAIFETARGDGGTFQVMGASVPQPSDTPDEKRVSAYSPDAPQIVPQIVVAAEQFNRMVRMMEKGQKIKMELSLSVKVDENQKGLNIVGEIPGSDLKDEIVIIGGHFDSWHAGTGATDNASGTAVALEAMRILKALDLKPRRTIRVGLWGGEEQGFLGSRAYVKEHFGERDTTAKDVSALVKKKPDYEKFSVYFNDDNGTGKFRGIYMQGNEATRPIFRPWLTPFIDMGASTLTPTNTGGTDITPFESIGLPAFQFIQDGIEYFSRTWHTNMDVFDRLQEEDLKQSAIIMAAFAYNAAMRDEKFPRKPLTMPRSGSGGFGF